MSESTLDVGTLASMAGLVAQEADEAAAAHEREKTAKAVLLETIVAAIRPALRALSSRPSVECRYWWPDNVSTAEETTRAKWRGILLSDDKAGPERDHPRANRGQYGGAELWLVVEADGWHLAELQYEGNWSCWQGESAHWSAKRHDYATPLDAIRDGWDEVDQYVERLAAKVKAAMGSRKQASTAATARAERLEAVARLARNK